jgi:DNA-directed RNA polymerase subunit RPC12/RpoP
MFFYWCPYCPQKLHADPRHFGYRARCPRCGLIHQVPHPDDPFQVGQDDTQTVKSSDVGASPESLGSGGITDGAGAATVGTAVRAPDGAAAAAPAGDAKARSNPFAPFETEASRKRTEPRSNIFRLCPGCKRLVEVDNQWAGLLCKQCGSEIA